MFLSAFILSYLDHKANNDLIFDDFYYNSSYRSTPFELFNKNPAIVRNLWETLDILYGARLEG